MGWFSIRTEIRELQETSIQLLKNQSNLSSTIATLYEQVTKQKDIIDNLTASNNNLVAIITYLKNGGLDAIDYFDDEDPDDEIN